MILKSGASIEAIVDVILQCEDYFFKVIVEYREL